MTRFPSFVFISPARDWAVVRLSGGFKILFLEGSDWRDAGWGLFRTCAAAVAFVDSL